ncbi:MAG: prolipoprotein diacylglyceryl transferase [Oscillochloris sp.]|nr:prolipoprotein diacylglyceryl transferase [Oscillochloris sp.]
MVFYPPDDPFLFSISLFGLPITVRWYGVIIMTGALVAALVATRRARTRGFHPDHVWNQLLFGLLLGIAGARIYYVAFEWERFSADPLSALNITNGGLAVHGSLIGALLAVLIYTAYTRLPLRAWIDVCVPSFLLGQAIGRWGNFFNQEAYGVPTPYNFGLRIDPEYRVEPFTDLQRYPIDTLFHPTFLYESLWNLAGFGLLLWLDRYFGVGAPDSQRKLRPGDLLLLYGIIYSSGRVWIEGLRTDSLCSSGVGGDCAGALRVAQLVSIGLIVLCLAVLGLNHRRRVDHDRVAV